MVSHASGKEMLTCICIQNMIKIYRVVQEKCTLSLSANGRIDGGTSLAIIVQTQGSCNMKYKSYRQYQLSPIEIA